MASQIGDARLLRAVREAVARVKAEDGIMPVRDVARQLLRDLDGDAAGLPAIVDALCAECILHGIVIEFQRPHD